MGPGFNPYRANDERLASVGIEFVTNPDRFDSENPNHTQTYSRSAIVNNLVDFAQNEAAGGRRRQQDQMILISENNVNLSQSNVVNFEQSRLNVLTEEHEDLEQDEEEKVDPGPQ